MLLLPYERFTIETDLSPEEVRQRLADAIEPRRWLFFYGYKPYRGKLDGDRFRIYRISYFRHPFRPIIHGEIISRYPGTTINMTVRPSFVGIGAGIVFLGILAIPPLTALYDWLISPSRPIMGTLASFGLIALLFFGVSLVAFKVETAQSRKFFRKLLEAKEVGTGKSETGN